MRSSMSVPTHASTSSSNTLPPRASNSVLTLHTIFGSLSGWFFTLIQVLMSVSCDISTSRSNTSVDVLHPPHRLWEIDLIASLHTIYAYLTGLLLTLMRMKNQGSSTNPFSEHPTLMTLFLIAILVYIISLITHMRGHYCSELMVGVCHISGGLACELLLLVLVSPVRSLIINVSSLALILMLMLCSKYLFHAAEGTEEQGSEMVAGP